MHGITIKFVIANMTCDGPSMPFDIQAQVWSLLLDQKKIGNCILVNKAWKTVLLDSNVIAQYRKARQDAADSAELHLLCRDDEEIESDPVEVEVIVRYGTRTVFGSYLGLMVKMWDDVLDIQTPLHDGIADPVQQALQLALKEEWTILAKLSSKATHLPKGFEYVLPQPWCRLYNEPWCKANFVYRRFQKAHRLGLV